MPTQSPAKSSQAVQTMKAVRIHQYGGPHVLQYEDAPRPEPGAGELLIRVRAAGVNPIDWKIREGTMKSVIPYDLPMIPGWDMSGIVETAGTGATRLKKGDEVYSRPDVSRNGAYAEFIVVKESEVALKPKSVDFVQAAGIPLAGSTAWQALFDLAGLKAGQKVLIHGASGGVGGFAVQFAKAKGAYVIGTASKENVDYVRQLGADEVIDYRAQRFEEAARDIDVVLDTIGGETQDRSWNVLKKGGALVSLTQPPSQEEAERRHVRGLHQVTEPNAQELAQIAELVDEGRVKVNVETVLPLSEARRAHELSQTGHQRGKIVLNILL